MRGSDAYLQAVVTVLRNDRNLFPNPEVANASCAITTDDRPHAYAGSYFIACYKNEVVGIQGTQRHHEYCSIVTAITLRTSDTPQDRIGPARISKDIQAHPRLRYSIDELSELVINAISHSEQIIIEGNNILQQAERDSGSCLLTPLYYEQETPNGPQIVGPNHFRSGNPKTGDGSRESGLLNKITFAGGERYRVLNVPS